MSYDLPFECPCCHTIKGLVETIITFSWNFKTKQFKWLEFERLAIDTQIISNHRILKSLTNQWSNVCSFAKLSPSLHSNGYLLAWLHFVFAIKSVYFSLLFYPSVNLMPIYLIIINFSAKDFRTTAFLYLPTCLHDKSALDVFSSSWLFVLLKLLNSTTNTVPLLSMINCLDLLYARLLYNIYLPDDSQTGIFSLDFFLIWTFWLLSLYPIEHSYFSPPYFIIHC